MHITQTKTGGIVIDATSGNGKDALFLATLLRKREDCSLICIDIQEKAIKATRELLLTNGHETSTKIKLILDSHENLPLQKQNLLLIVYNLGYLPKGDKSITTKTHSSIQSILQATDFLMNGGMISVTCYPGHPEGLKEQLELSELFHSFDPSIWEVNFFQWTNRANSPSIFLIQKKQPLADKIF